MSEFPLVRAVSADDRDAWQKLFQAYGVFYRTAFDDDICEGVWKWLMEDNHPVRGFVAETAGTVVGFTHVRAQHNTFTAGPSWFLDDLFTAPEARGNGVATALIEHVKHYAGTRGGGTLRWITAADNQGAQRLYDTLAQRTSWVVYQDETEGASR
jgi:ribosomal protein S18 acetylase RimI-like enzyme